MGRAGAAGGKPRRPAFPPEMEEREGKGAPSKFKPHCVFCHGLAVPPACMLCAAAVLQVGGEARLPL